MSEPPIDIVRRDAYRMTADEAGELLTLQYAAWLLEAIENDTLAIPTLHENVDDVRRQLADPTLTIYGLRRSGRLIGTVRWSVLPDGSAFIGRLGVVPDRHGEGWGSALLRYAEAALPTGTTRIELFTGVASLRNHRLYERHGYAIFDRQPEHGYVRLEKYLATSG